VPLIIDKKIENTDNLKINTKKGIDKHTNPAHSPIPFCFYSATDPANAGVLIPSLALRAQSAIFNYWITLY
jgi:hypothetical protein